MRGIIVPRTSTRDRTGPGALLLILVVGTLVRGAPVLLHDFPLNDGGLFVQAVRDIQRAGGVPAFLDYNGAHIPFVYPPLGFIAAAIVERLTPLDLFGTFRALPLLASIATVPAFLLVARALLPSRFAASLAGLAFACVPRAFDWMVAGGGVTRAPGFLFALLAIWAGARLMDGEQAARWPLVASGVFGGLALLCHPEAAVFTALSLVLLALRARSRRAWGRLVGASLVGLVVAMPWWGLALVRFGPGPLLAGASTGPDPVAALADLAAFTFTDAPYFPLVAALGLLGLALELGQRRWLLPAWLTLIFLVDERSAPTFTMVPLALLAGVGLADGVLARLDAAFAALPAQVSWPPARQSSGVARVVFPAIGALLLVGGLAAPLAPDSPLFALTPADRTAMRWVADHTPRNARFVVVAPVAWQFDAVAEWLPVLGERVSVDTVQGAEWRGAAAFGAQVQVHQAYAACAYLTAGCLADAAHATDTAFTYVYVPTEPRAPWVGPPLAQAGIPCCTALTVTLRTDPRYVVVYDGPGAVIAARVPMADSP